MSFEDFQWAMQFCPVCKVTKIKAMEFAPKGKMCRACASAAARKWRKKNGVNVEPTPWKKFPLQRRR